MYKYLGQCFAVHQWRKTKKTLLFNFAMLDPIQGDLYKSLLSVYWQETAGNCSHPMPGVGASCSRDIKSRNSEGVQATVRVMPVTMQLSVQLQGSKLNISLVAFPD